MKNFTCNLFLFLSLFFVSNFISAQSIPNGVLPEVGDIVHSIAGESENINEGNSGNNVTWDFTAMVPMPLAEPTTVTYINPDDTPHAAVFPNANLAIETPSNLGSTYSYYVKNNDRLEYIGGEALGTFIYYDEDPQLVLDADMSGSDIVMDQYKGYIDNPQSQTFTSGTQESQVDAAGTLKMPSGEYSNAVRVLNIGTRVDSTGSEFFTSITRIEIRTYTWFIPNQVDPVMSIIYVEGQSETTIPGSPPTINEIPLTKSVVYNPNIEGGTTATMDLAHLTGINIEGIAPNPTADMLNIEMTVETGQLMNFILSNILGRQLIKKSIMVQEGHFNHRLDLSNYSNGTYILSISNGREIISKKVIKTD